MTVLEVSESAVGGGSLALVGVPRVLGFRVWRSSSSSTDMEGAQSFGFCGPKSRTTLACEPRVVKYPVGNFSRSNEVSLNSDYCWGHTQIGLYTGLGADIIRPEYRLCGPSGKEALLPERVWALL